MKAIKASFTRNLKIAFSVMLLITLAIAWYFYDSARWFALDVERITAASRVLDTYQEASRQVAIQLYTVTDYVERGVTPGEDVIAGNNSNIIEALDRAQRAFKAEDVHYGAADESALLEDATVAARAIIEASADIDRSLADGDPEAASAILSELRGEGEASRFSVLIDSLVGERQTRLAETGAQAMSLSGYVIRLLPLVAAMLLMISFLAMSKFSRSLKRSIGALHEAVAEFSRGNLGHRIPPIREREFQELGHAFNAMATQLSDQEEALRNSNLRLESMVEERTRELQESNEKLARVDEHRRRLLADISHEFRTPLTVIKGESEIAMRGKNLAAEDYRESFQRIIDTTDHATTLVEDLLFIVRANAGEPRLQLKPVEMTEIVRKVCDEFAGRAGQKGIRIVHSGGRSRAYLEGDPQRLWQVFAILLDNALRYSHPDGTIEVNVDSGKDEVSIMVKDEGIGLTEEEASQAFKRFFRGRQAVNHAQQGSGLGLPVAKAIVEAHKGRITLEGEPGKGAVATVRLPAKGHLRAVA